MTEVDFGLELNKASRDIATCLSDLININRPITTDSVDVARSISVRRRSIEDQFTDALTRYALLIQTR